MPLKGLAKKAELPLHKPHQEESENSHGHTDDNIRHLDK
jgi:hypothetical protein